MHPLELVLELTQPVHDLDRVRLARPVPAGLAQISSQYPLSLRRVETHENVPLLLIANRRLARGAVARHGVGQKPAVSSGPRAIQHTS